MRKASVAVTAMLVLPLLGSLPASATDTGTVTQITNGNNKSTVPIISGDGNVIAFHTLATDLGGTPTFTGIENVFTSTTSGLAEAAIDGVFPALSANGRWIAYSKPSTTGGVQQVHRYDRQTDTDIAITTGNAESGAADNLAGVRVDNSGNVVFQSKATDLVGGDSDDGGGWDIYLYATSGGTITKLSDESEPHFRFPDIAANGSRVVYNSVNTEGTDRKVYQNTTAGTAQSVIAAGNGRDELPRVNDNGTKVVFRSDSTDLPGATGNSTPNVTVWSSAGTFARVTNLTGTSGITNPAISGDGGFVAFQYEDGEIHRAAAVAGGTRIQLSDNPFDASLINYAALNSDGSKVVYAQSVDGTVAGVEILLWSAATTPPPPTTDIRCTFSDPILNAEYRAKTGNDARIARLYAAYFLRNPDPSGFAFWQTQIANGTWTNDRAASFFGESAEFVSLYGAGLSNEQFVDRLYANVFCRQADAGGRTFWLGKLNEGWTRGRVALSFSDSPEFRTRTMTPLAN